MPITAVILDHCMVFCISLFESFYRSQLLTRPTGAEPSNCPKRIAQKYVFVNCRAYIGRKPAPTIAPFSTTNQDYLFVNHLITNTEHFTADKKGDKTKEEIRGQVGKFESEETVKKFLNQKPFGQNNKERKDERDGEREETKNSEKQKVRTVTKSFGRK
jgi:hypothetical protein